MTAHTYKAKQDADVIAFINEITEQMNSDEPIKSAIYFRTGKPMSVADTAQFIDESLQKVQNHPAWIAFTTSEVYRQLGITLCMQQTDISTSLLHLKRRKISVIATTTNVRNNLESKLAIVEPNSQAKGTVSLMQLTTTQTQESLNSVELELEA